MATKPAPPPNLVRRMYDRLSNVMSGQGTSIDRRSGRAYIFLPLDHSQAEAGYRTSWLIRKIVDVPAKDMTRAWRDWQATKEQIEAIEKEEKRLGLREKVKRALILSRLYGGGALILGTNDSDPMLPLDPERVKKDGLTYVHAMAPQQLGMGTIIMDPADPWFGKPSYFEISASSTQRVKLHPSRVVDILGQRAPEGAVHQTLHGFWGDPIMQAIGDAVGNADTAQAGFAALIDEAKLDIIKIPDLLDHWGTDEHEAKLLRRLEVAAAGKSTWRALLLDAGEEWEQRQMVWAGIPQVLSTFLEIVAGAADIPVTRLLGQSPKGLQSTGEGEAKDYHDKVKADQEEILAPALDRIDDLLIRSALGSRPPEVHYVFADLVEPDEAAEGLIEKQRAETLKIYADSGMLHEEAITDIAKNSMIESGRWPGCEEAFESAGEIDREADVDPDDPEALAAVQTKGENNVVQLRKAASKKIEDARKSGLLTDLQATLLMADFAPGGGRSDAGPFDDKYNPNQPRDPGGEGGGQWVSVGAPDETDATHPPQVGKPFLVYRAGASSEDGLANRNAGNGQTVGLHLVRLGDPFGPSYAGQARDPADLTIHAYKVTLNEAPGDYQLFNSGKGSGPDQVGYKGDTRGELFSFGKSGYEAERLATFPAREVLRRLKVSNPGKNYETFDDFGGNETARAIREILAERMATRSALMRIAREPYTEGDPLVVGMGDRNHYHSQARDPGGEGGGQWVAAGGEGMAHREGHEPVESGEVHPVVAATMTDEQIYFLRKQIAEKAGQEEILAAMKPLYDSIKPGPETLVLGPDGEMPTDFFEGRAYNLPGGEKGDLKAAITALEVGAAGFAGPGGLRYSKEAIIVLGPAAAGKSTIAERIAAANGFAIVDSDEAKKLIPGFDGGLGAGAVHEESSVMGRMLETNMTRRGANIIVPAVGGNAAGPAARIERLRAMGYRVTVVNVDVNKNEATRRMASRALRTGRTIPRDFVLKVGDKPQRTYNQIKGSADGYAEIDANGPQGSEAFTEKRGYRYGI